MTYVRFATNTKVVTQVPYLKRIYEENVPSKRVIFRETIIPTKTHDGSLTDTKNTIIETTIKNVYDNIDIIMEMWEKEYIPEMRELLKCYFTKNYQQHQEMLEHQEFSNYNRNIMISQEIGRCIEHIKTILRKFRFEKIVSLLPKSAGKYQYQIHYRYKWILREFLESLYELEEQVLEMKSNKSVLYNTCLPDDIYVEADFNIDFDKIPVLI